MKKLICIIFVFVLIIPFKVAALGTSAKAAVLINGETGEVIYEHNSDKVLPMASTTKIMTALLLCEYGQFDREIMVTEEMLRVEGSSMGLLAGDRVTLYDLLYGLLLASGNDAANVIAYVLGGTVDGFVKMMNQKAESLGLKNTNFATPSGLDAEDHYTTALDLANLARIAMQNKDFAAAAGCESAVLYYGNPPYRRTLSNHNKLLKNFDGAIGVKTGYTKKSGRCLVSAAKRDGKYVIAVTLCDPNDWQDHSALLEYGFSQLKTVEILPEKQTYTISVIGAKEQSFDVNIDPYIINSFNGQNFSCVVNLPKFVYAPVKKGENIGSVVYMQDGKEIHRSKITADCDISVLKRQKGFFEKIIENAKYIFKNIWEK